MMILNIVRTQSEKTRKFPPPKCYRPSKTITRRNSSKEIQPIKELQQANLREKWKQMTIGQCSTPVRIRIAGKSLLYQEGTNQDSHLSQLIGTQDKMMIRNCRAYRHTPGYLGLETLIRGSNKQLRHIIEKSLLSAVRLCLKMRAFLLQLDHLSPIMSLSLSLKWGRLIMLQTLPNRYRTSMKCMQCTNDN